ncbi:SDR family NAD(P)-dependent oxidoreductase [Smaragdicoccus niigatensis]|uniref:SDR family NAD(P)-dependent oxidoreductase n=1 Tax=Smaragdicoccus niigatensis TaxID=359359 RepID=UPI00035F4C19|nr:SDR family oxidoreductase [Smaragdicoccus niigatensis]
MNVALVTGGSAGLGRALVTALADRGWTVITDARDGSRLPQSPNVIAITGDITDGVHRRALLEQVKLADRLDLLVHNASALGPRSGDTRYRALAETTPEDFQDVWRPNIGAPLVLTSLLLPWLVESRGILLSISSDAAVDHYEGFGLYGASKAALDHITLTFGAENPTISAYAVDPGDMRTEMHQEWFPGEDISDRPLPETVVPHLLALINARPANGRFRAADINLVQEVA